MNDKEAFKTVYDKLIEGSNLFQGVYDAKNGSEEFMHGISTVLEYIAQQVSEDERAQHEDMFTKNMIESKDLARTRFLQEFVKHSDRYRNFTILPHSQIFSDYFKDKDIAVVQLYSTDRIGGDIVGFCGQFKWKNNKIKSLDHDSYNSNMTIYGYSWFKDKNKNNCLDILVGEDW